MKKIIALFALCMVTLATQAKDITIYVKATTAPYIWVWESGDGGKTLTGTSWPGVKMTQKKTVKETEFWYMTFTSDKILNVIFNDGGTNGTGTGAKESQQTNDITSDRYFTYDGKVTATDVTEDYADIPDAVIEFLALTGNHKADWNTNDYFTYLGDNKYQIFVDLTGVDVNDDDPLGERWEFSARPNGQGWVNEANATVEDPDNVLDHEDPSISNFVIYLDDPEINCHQFTITATWVTGKSSLAGWTVRIEKGDTSGISEVLRDVKAQGKAAFNLAGQRVSQNYKGIVVTGGKKIAVK